MATADYNITSTGMDAEGWAGCRLFIELGRNFFHYAMLTDNNSIAALRYYRIPATTGKTMVESLEEILAGDDLLNTVHKAETIIYNVPETHLVPAAFYKEEMNESLIGLLHGDFAKGHLMSEQIPGTDIYNVYRIPADLHRFLQARFSPALFRHFDTAWSATTEARKDGAYVMFYPNELLVILINGQAVRLIQRLRYETSEDVGYYLLNIYNQQELSVHEFPLMLSGMIAADSAMYEELMKYFMLVETVPPPAELLLPEEFNAFPSHFFTPVLKASACVS